MILACNSCEKKFVVPDNAISSLGRMVQCSSCGNKWKQFPISPDLSLKKKIDKIKSTPIKTKKTPNSKKERIKKRRGPSLYSPEYLAKKHGVIINKDLSEDQNIKRNFSKINFGFYNFLIVVIVIIIFFSKLFYFTQETLIEKFPISKIYIDYLFESIGNIKIILESFLAS